MYVTLVAADWRLFCLGLTSLCDSLLVALDFIVWIEYDFVSLCESSVGG